MSPKVAALPEYLKSYIAKQDYERYTAQDHAAWRYIMRQSRAFFKNHAHPIYLDGLAKTGIPLDRIPRIEDMDRALSRLGWGAVAVSGFIPPAAFLEFQAREVLPIAVDMRTLAHIAYTPAPDIVHEAAGHAPIVADEGYRHYLSRYAEMAQKAIFSAEDLEVYDAIRRLSDTKENPDCTAAEIEQGEIRLTQAEKNLTWDSEASVLARLYWWTAEYGLMGTLEDYKIFGAGLLSSVGESQNVFSPAVRKVPFSLDCIKVSYDITRPQPQLFVARDTAHLVQVLKELEATLSFVRGGVESLAKAQKARTTTSAILDSGIAVSGLLTEFRHDADGVLTFLRFTGPAQLTWRGALIPGHGSDYHTSGYSAPLGRLSSLAEKAAAQLTEADLRGLGLRLGEFLTLEYTSGFRVHGRVRQVVNAEGKIQVLSFEDCTVSLGDERLFEPQWGIFDLIFGERVVSVQGGAVDKEHFKDTGYGVMTTTPARQSPYSPRELRLFQVYQRTIDARELLSRGEMTAAVLRDLCLAAADESLAADWLVSLECLELGHQVLGPIAKPDWLKVHALRLDEIAATSDQTTRELIQKGLALVTQTPDKN